MKKIILLAIFLVAILVIWGCSIENDSTLTDVVLNAEGDAALKTPNQNGNLNPGIIPPHANPYGRSYGEWSIAWWQWLISAPFDQNPGLDETGEFIPFGQSGPVWFIAPNFGGETVRYADIPAGKGLFILLMGFEASELEGHGTGEEELRGLADWVVSGIENLVCEIDGVSIEGLDDFRVASPTMFSIDVPENNIFQVDGLDIPAGTYYPSVCDGYYIMLNPLPAGEHIIHLSGEIPGIEFWQDIIINLNVVGGHGHGRNHLN